MSVTFTFSGQSFTIPSQAERNWATQMNTYLLALAANSLPRSGGSFVLAADLDLGAAANVYLKGLVSKTAGPSATGYIRMANNEGLGWRNVAGTSDIVMKVNASDQLEVNGVAVPTAASTVTLTGSQTLTNKVIAAGSSITTAVNETDVTDTTKMLATDLSAAATATTTTLKVSQTVSRIVTLPDATDTLVGKATTDTLSNKSISGSTNTLSAVPITALSAFTSAQLATQLTDETGTGAAVFATSPTLVTPALGTPSALVLTNATGLPIAGGGTGQSTAAAAFGALSPNSTKGDITVFGAANTRLPVGANGFAIVADSAQALGVKWAAVSGGLTPVAKTANYTANNNEMIEGDTTAAAFTVTLPPVPAGGGVVGVLDAAGTCSATNFIRITPATGQSLDGYAANDSVLLDYAGANVIAYAAAGATSWKLQKQATTMVQGGQVPGYTGASAIGTGFIGEIITSSLTTTSVPVSASNLQSTAVRRLTFPTVGIFQVQANVGGAVPAGSYNRLRLYTSGTGLTTYGLTNDLWITTSGSTGTNGASGWVVVTAAGATLDLFVDTLNGALTGGPYTFSSTFNAIRSA